MMEKNKNILHVVNVFFVVPYFLGDQIGYFKRLGNNMFLACSHSDELENESLKQGFEYLETPISRNISIFSDLKSTFSICRYIKKNKINIVVGHTPKGALLAMLASFLSRVPKRIYFRHGLVFETTTGLKRSLLIWMDRLASLLSTQIVVVSPSVYEESLKYKLNSKRKQTLLNKGTCNGIDLIKFDRSKFSILEINSLKEKLSIPSDAFVVGYTGRLVRDKGIIELVEGFLKIKERHANVYLLLVGMLEDRDALPSSTVDAIRQSPNIINTGYIKYRDIDKYYSLMDIYTLPSYREGFPTSVLEASAMSLPVITTRATGCVDSIIEGKTGVFVDHNQSSILSAIELFINNKNLVQTYGGAGRLFVQNNFDQKIIWDRLNLLYNT